MIKNIIYDYGYVLAYPKSGNWFIPSNVKQILGIKNFLKIIFRKHKYRKAFQKTYIQLNNNHLLHTEEEELKQFIEFYTTILKDMGIHKDIERMSGLLAKDTVCNDNRVTFYEDVMEELQRAHVSYKIAVLSDTWPSLKRILEYKKITPLLAGLIMSCDYGICKDNIKLFHIAISNLNITPEETAFIDDSEGNLDNAVKTGLVPILIDRKGKVTHSKYPIVHNLNEAFLLIESSNKEEELGDEEENIDNKIEAMNSMIKKKTRIID